jgi:hypothetical protein
MKTTILFIAAILILTGCRNPSAPETTLSESEDDSMAIFKRDWKAGDRPVSADVNRWESNTEEAYNLAGTAKYWGQLMHISGNVGGNAAQTIERDAVVPVQTMCVYVAPRPAVGLGTSAAIRFIGFNLNPGFRLRIQAEGESSYFQSLSESDYYDAWYNGTVTPTLFVNETDSPVKKRIIISAVNVSTRDELLSPSAGWSFQLSGLVTFDFEQL